jgi:hypothetical protein
MKFPVGTVAGHYKAAVAENPERDIVRFDNQKLNWTLKEFDRYSSAFAFGLLEQGYRKGDSLVMYADQTASAEQLVAQMGAIKAGVKVVTFVEDTEEALDNALKATNATGLIFSPDAQVSENQTRANIVQKLMPELSTMYLGDELAVR